MKKKNTHTYTHSSLCSCFCFRFSYSRARARALSHLYIHICVPTPKSWGWVLLNTLTKARNFVLFGFTKRFVIAACIASIILACTKDWKGMPTIPNVTSTVTFTPTSGSCANDLWFSTHTHTYTHIYKYLLHTHAHRIRICNRTVGEISKQIECMQSAA